MIKLTVLLLTILTVKIASGQICHGKQVVMTQDGQCDYNDYMLEFEDNFDGNELDLSKWNLPYQGVLRNFNHSTERQWYANTGNIPAIPISNNIEISNGTLKLIARKESTPIIGTYISDFSINPWTYTTESFDYSSAEIDSKYKFGYGKYEIRCKIPSGRGFWPAFWMYGIGSGDVNNEIDVFEFWNNSTNDHNLTVHYNGQMCLTDYNGPDYSQAFHTYTVIWNNYKIEWYVDGDLKRRSTKFYTILGQPVDCNGIQAFSHYIMDKVFPLDPMNIIVNLALQTGTYAPDNSTPFPSSLEIDYIRYYK
jgi:beta-glucanase (GH16 family)